MKKKYEVELNITKTYSVKVQVEGEFAGKGDPAIAKAAERVADNMDHELWDYEDSEFEVFNVFDVEQ